MAERILSLYACYQYTDSYWRLDEPARREFRARLAKDVADHTAASHFYSVFPARTDTDVLIWSSWAADEGCAASSAFVEYAGLVGEWRGLLKPVQSLWGFTKPSMYSRGKSEQDMDPLEGPRSTYLVVYPFSKSKEWYLMSMDTRQGMMNEHIKLGKQYFDIKQLLLYSFGLQDQEFVVSYETDDLPKFSELVQALRSTEGRRYTSMDTPLITGVYRTPEEFIH